MLRALTIAVLVTSLLMPWPALAAEHHGHVTFGGIPVPGATVTAKQGDKTFTTITDPMGDYFFPDLADGTWTIQVDMSGFAAIKEDVAVMPGAPVPQWELQILPLDQIKAQVQPVEPPPEPPPASPTSDLKQRPNQQAPGQQAQNSTPESPSGAFANQSTEELNQRAADGFLINGTTNNGAASPFAQFPAFGNNRRGGRSLYNGNIGLTFDNSNLDARSFSLTGQDALKPEYNRLTGLASFGGPLRIPHLIRNGPFFIINYQWTRNRNASTPSGLVPTAEQRTGNLSQFAGTIIDPTNGLPFAGNIIPQSRISPQAQALLSLYPLPNFPSTSYYNYEIPILSGQHTDAMQTRLNKQIGRKNQLSGVFAFQDARMSTPNLFEFLDTTDSLGLNTNVNWRHTFTQRFYGNLGVQFSRFSLRTTPYFENLENISGQAGITGNNQEPVNWGPPALNFSSGIAALSDAAPSFTRNQTSAVSYDVLWSRGRHEVSFGGDFKRQEMNLLSQQNPRGTFSFTGAATSSSAMGSAATGYDFADFLLGIPDTSSIAFGNADKYFRSSIYEAYVQDVWRVSPSLTLNLGVRWEYWTPIHELYGRLVNLDVLGNFQAVEPVVASNPVGSLTGQSYPSSLIRPDPHAVEPRASFSWRPFAASSMVVRGGYGVYYNTSVYQNIAIQMAQQYPLSKSLSVANSASNPLSLANGFNEPIGVTPNTFGVDPNFRIGYSQTASLSVQRDLPGSLVMIVSYLGIKGTRGMQEFLPNTYPLGGVNPCPSCPTGFAYLTSNGNSTREAGTIQLRRRLHNGFTANLQYTFAKAIDDVSSLGGGSVVAAGGAGGGPGGASGISNLAGPAGGGSTSAAIAQNWLDLSAERSLSSFDQRHALTAQIQYTSGMGMGGGTLLNGWRGALLKEWTFLSQITVGSGLPLTPLYFAPANGTGITGTIRPDYTGASVYSAPAGRFLNPNAYVAPAASEWGNAGRDSITGPGQFSLNASMGRTFRWGDRFNIDLRVDATNALNHVVFQSWLTTVNSAQQFGVPTAPNGMRSLQTTLRLRF
jgi:trimeric autotransporter adhesin